MKKILSIIFTFLSINVHAASSDQKEHSFNPNHLIAGINGQNNSEPEPPVGIDAPEVFEEPRLEAPRRILQPPQRTQAVDDEMLEGNRNRFFMDLPATRTIIIPPSPERRIVDFDFIIRREEPLNLPPLRFSLRFFRFAAARARAFIRAVAEDEKRRP